MNGLEGETEEKVVICYVNRAVIKGGKKLTQIYMVVGGI
jgi:hypothetical protein